MINLHQLTLDNAEFWMEMAEKASLVIVNKEHIFDFVKKNNQ